MPHLEDPRWEGQDSQSLPDRPAHPDPSRRAECGDPNQTPSHGIYGFLELKHGLVSEEELDADAARGAQVQVDALEQEKAAIQARADAGDDGAKARLKHLDSSLKSAQKTADGSPDSGDLPAARQLEEAILSGEIVPSIENASHAEGKGAGKRDDVAPGNAPVGAEKK